MKLHVQFWKEQPALLLAISLLIGTSSFLFWESPWNWIFPSLWALYLACFRFWAEMLLILGGALYSWALYSGVPSGQIGYFSIISMQPQQSPFQKGHLYKGLLYMGRHRIPCSISHLGDNYPRADSDYIVRGQLQTKGAYTSFFKAKEWIPVKTSWSFAHFRYQMKERFRQFLDQHLHRPRTASFLGSLITGDVEDRMLRYEFNRLGLQHILAISGFHFAILIAFCSFFLGLFLSHRWKNITLLLALNGYFLFVGALPAVQRSWLTALLYLIGKLIGRHSSGLNLLGVAILIEALLDPLITAHLGFQLSFLSCAGILLFAPFFEQLLLSAPPSKLSPFAQHISLLSTFIRKTFCITLAVYTAIFPLLLFHFHSFPLVSLLYNLFFPFLVSAAIFALLISLLIFLFLPPLAPYFFQATDFFTYQLLNLTTYPPPILNYSIHAPPFPGWLIPFYLFGLFCLTNSSFSGKILGTYGGRSSAG